MAGATPGIHDMEIGNIQGKGGLDRPDRTQPPQPGSAADPAGVPQDSAQISSAGRDASATVEALSERARQQDAESEERIAAAEARLESGQLDTPQTFRAVAERLLHLGF